MISRFPYLAPKLFYFPRIRLFVSLWSFSPFLLVEFLSLFWNALFCLYCFILSQYFLSLPSLTRTFGLIPSSWIVCFYCIALFIFCSNIFLLFCSLSIFSSLRFLICISSLMSQPGFEFLFVLLSFVLFFLEFFTPALAESFLLKFEFPQVSGPFIVLWLIFKMMWSRCSLLVLLFPFNFTQWSSGTSKSSILISSTF